MLSAVLSRCVGCAICKAKYMLVYNSSRTTQSSCCLQETSSSQHVGQKGAEQNGGAQDPQEHARSVVEQCVATQLLQPDLQLPVDSQAVAKKVICRAVSIPALREWRAWTHMGCGANASVVHAVPRVA